MSEHDKDKDEEDNDEEDKDEEERPSILAHQDVEVSDNEDDPADPISHPPPPATLDRTDMAPRTLSADEIWAYIKNREKVSVQHKEGEVQDSVKEVEYGDNELEDSDDEVDDTYEEYDSGPCALPADDSVADYYCMHVCKLVTN